MTSEAPSLSEDIEEILYQSLLLNQKLSSWNLIVAKTNEEKPPDQIF